MTGIWTTLAMRFLPRGHLSESTVLRGYPPQSPSRLHAYLVRDCGTSPSQFMEHRQPEFGGQTLENFSFETGNGNQRNDHVPDRPPLIIQTRNILTALSELGTNTTLTTSCFCVGHHSPHYPKLGTPTHSKLHRAPKLAPARIPAQAGRMRVLTRDGTTL